MTPPRRCKEKCDMKKALSLLLALVMCLGLLPVTASAAEAELPDWYFLFAIFKNVDADCGDGNGNTVHTKYTMTQEEIDFVKEDAQGFETYMNQVGVMRAHVDVVEIDTPITELAEYSSGRGGYLGPEQAEPLLKGKVDLDRYDHVTCATSLNVFTGYLGAGGMAYENGTGHTAINLRNREYCLNILRADKTFPASMYVHEFLHFMEVMDKKWGVEFGLHDVRINHYSPDNDSGRECYTDIMLNQARGTAGTGVHPAAWQYPPRVLRTMTEWTVPSSVTFIGSYAFHNLTNLKKVIIPDSVTSIGVCAFQDCTSLKEVSMSSGVVKIEDWAFGCHEPHSALERVSIPASVTSIGYAAFHNSSLTDIYYGGTEAQWKAIQIGKYNEQLTRATIHYNSPVPSTPQPTTPSYQVSDWARDRVALAVKTGLAAESLGGDYRVNITRAQFAATAVKLYEAMSGQKVPAASSSSFTDTSDPVILQAADLGFVSGVGGGRFSPDALVTREQAAVMLSSVYTKLGGSIPAVISTAFADDASVSSWAASAVAFMSDKGIVSGVGENRFSPQGQASIEQALLISLKMFEDLK